MRIACTFFHDTSTYESGALLLHACIHRLRIRATLRQALRICMEPHNLAGEGEYCKIKYLTPCFSNQGLPKNVFVQILAWIHVAAVFFVKSFPGIPRDCQGKLGKIWSSMLPSFRIPGNHCLGIFIIFSRMRSKGSRFTLGVHGG